MKLKQKITALFFILTATLGISVALQPSTAMAATCGGIPTSVVTCDQKGGKEAKDTGAWGILLLVLNIMTVGVGILAVGGIVYGAIMFATARDSAEQVKKGIEIMINVAIGIIAYGLMYLLLNFLVPGGIFS